MGSWLLIIIVTSLGVLIDARNIGVKKGLIKGMGNMGHWGWFFSCLLIWIMAFPLYLVKRPEFKRAISGEQQPSNMAEATDKKGLSAIHWLGIIVFGGIACLFLFGQKNGQTGIERIASGGLTDYVIRVEGTPGLQFSGSYLGVTGGGSSQESVDGITPASYRVSGTIVSTTFQKKSESGTLTVSIIVDGHIVKTATTSAEYGVVAVASN